MLVSSLVRQSSWCRGDGLSKYVAVRNSEREIWQPILWRIEIAGAYPRLVEVCKVIGFMNFEFNETCFRMKVREFAWESCGVRSKIGGSIGS